MKSNHIKHLIESFERESETFGNVPETETFETIVRKINKQNTKLKNYHFIK